MRVDGKGGIYHYDVGIMICKSKDGWKRWYYEKLNRANG